MEKSRRLFYPDFIRSILDDLKKTVLYSVFFHPAKDFLFFRLPGGDLHVRFCEKFEVNGLLLDFPGRMFIS